MTDLVVSFHRDSTRPLDPALELDSLKPMVAWLAAKHPAFATWFLKADTKEDALRYEAFGRGVDGETATKAVLVQQFKRKHERFIALWNGEHPNELEASLTLHPDFGPYPARVKFSTYRSGDSFIIGDWRSFADLVSLAVREWHPITAHVYSEPPYKRIFNDRPGVGWMLYLPRQFTPSDVPEARALVPVMDGKEKLGTIIVSVTDGVFDESNPEHVKVANDIEIRLVGQDMLPTYAQMTRP